LDIILALILLARHMPPTGLRCYKQWQKLALETMKEKCLKCTAGEVHLYVVPRRAICLSRGFDFVFVLSLYQERILKKPSSREVIKTPCTGDDRL